MRTGTISLVGVIVSAVMLLPCVTSSFAEEFVNTGAAPPSRYATLPEGAYSSGGIGYRGAAVGSFAGPYADSAYAASGFYGDYACQISPGDPWRRGFCEPVAVIAPR